MSDVADIKSIWRCTYCEKRFEVQESDAPIERGKIPELLAAYLTYCGNRHQSHDCNTSARGVAVLIGTQAYYRLPWNG